MTQPHTVLKHVGDIGASAASVSVVVSQWAQIITPILSMIIAIATLAWWIIRFADWWKTGRVGE